MGDKLDPEQPPAGESVPPGWSPNQPPPSWAAPQPGWTSGQPGWAAPEATEPVAWGDQRAASTQAGWAQPPRARPDIKPGVIPLRPLGVGEILDGAISTIRDHPRVMLGISAMVAVGSALLNGIASWITLRDFDSLDPATATDEEILDAFWTAMAALGSTALVVTLANVIATGILTLAIGKAVLGRALTLREAWESSRPRLLPLVGLWLLSTLIVAAVVIAPIVPGFALALAGSSGAAGLLALGLFVGFVLGVYMYVRLALAPPALMLEKQRVVAAIRRSSRLVKSSWWRVFWILLLAFILALILGQIIQTPFGVLGYGLGPYFGTTDLAAPSLADIAIASIGTIIAGTITLPFTAGVTTLLYIDRRIRREGLDIELARAARGSTDSAAASGRDDQ